MYVKLLRYTPEPEQLVAAAAKLCYSTCGIDDLIEKLDEEKVQKFLNHLMSLGHESPLEHITFTFGIEGCSRSLLAQITRHRIASFSVQSQRYCNLDRTFSYITPKAIEECEEAKKLFDYIMEIEHGAYTKLSNILKEKHIADGVESKIAEKMAIEDARAVLPNACETKMIVTMNLRELLHFFELRCCCYDAQTEVLTQQGWKPFKEVTTSDVFYTLNLSTQENEYQKATRIFEYDYRGDMVKVAGDSIDLLITPNHQVVASHSYENKKWQLEEVQNVEKWKCVLFKKNCKPISGVLATELIIPGYEIDKNNQHCSWHRTISNKIVDAHKLMRLIGFYLSDGYAVQTGQHYNIGFSKGDKSLLEEYALLLQDMSENTPRIFKDRSGWKLEITDRRLYHYFAPLGNAYTKRLPAWIWKYDHSLLKSLYDGLHDGDFNQQGNHIWSASKEMIDDIQRLMLHLGYSASTNICDRRGRVSNGFDADGNPYSIKTQSIAYTLTTNVHKNEPIIKTTNRTAFSHEPYDGKVYCVEVEKNHTLYVRRNGKACWSGNSRAQLEIRELACEMLRQCKEISPLLFKNAGPSCVRGKCKEGSMSCGNPWRER